MQYRGRKQDVLYIIFYNAVRGISLFYQACPFIKRNPVVKKLSPHRAYRGCPGSFSHSVCRTEALLSASLTVEAAFIVPFLFLSLLSFSSLFYVQRVQNVIQLELEQAAGIYAASGIKTYSAGTLWKEKAFMRWDEKEPYPVCYVCYSRKVPFLQGFFTGKKVYQQIVISDYSGKSMVPDEERTGTETVYLAENASVYHRDRYCTYLKLRIQTVFPEEIARRRNLSGEKYYPCRFCLHGVEPEGENGKCIYITAHGNRYHNSKSCSQLYRNVREVRLEETGGLPPCSKCAGDGS